MLVRKSEIARQRADNEWPREGETWPEFLVRIDRERESPEVAVVLAVLLLGAATVAGIWLGIIPL